MYRISIIDDERRAAEILEAMLLKYFPAPVDIRIITDPYLAVEHLLRDAPHLLFLDIKLPGLGGFDILAALPTREFKVIFVTAYDHFAIQAIKSSALDYLLKPVAEAELEAAITRFLSQEDTNLALKYELLMSRLQEQIRLEEKIGIANMETTLFFKPDEIVRCEAEGNYTCFYFRNRPSLLSAKTLKEYADTLDQKGFLRPHKSHLVNLSYVSALIGRSELKLVDGTLIPIARRRRSVVIDTLEQRHRRL